MRTAHKVRRPGQYRRPLSGFSNVAALIMKATPNKVAATIAGGSTNARTSACKWPNAIGDITRTGRSLLEDASQLTSQDPTAWGASRRHGFGCASILLPALHDYDASRRFHGHVLVGLRLSTADDVRHGQTRNLSPCMCGASYERDHKAQTDPPRPDDPTPALA
ncbi:hypothetical protein CCMA1212_006749 [Trichoderma ghanense]|uniref:Uncharacterized protein n=1 Tax=Trichoderma ghanense TaxID=65468 RepID=A0ABY2GZK6_9HYPO